MRARAADNPDSSFTILRMARATRHAKVTGARRHDPRCLFVTVVVEYTSTAPVVLGISRDPTSRRRRCDPVAWFRRESTSMSRSYQVARAHDERRPQPTILAPHLPVTDRGYKPRS